MTRCSRGVVMRVVGCCVAALALAAPGFGQETERTPIRTVVASSTQPVVIFTRVRTVTTVRLPVGEEIVHTVAGDAENWDLVARGRELAIKPYVANLVANVTVSCASGEVFAFTVVEDADAVTDYVVTVEAEEEQPALSAVDPAAVEVQYRPAALVAGLRERLAGHLARRERVLLEGRLEVERLWAAAETRRDEFVRDFAARVRLPYQVTEEAYEVPFLLRDLWTDGTFTYLRTEGQEIPAVHAFRGDSLEAVHTDVEPGGLLVVEQVIRHGTLSLGGREAWFGLAAEGGAMPQRRPGFFERTFARPPRMYAVWPAIGAVVAAFVAGR